MSHVHEALYLGLGSNINVHDPDAQQRERRQQGDSASTSRSSSTLSASAVCAQRTIRPSPHACTRCFYTMTTFAGCFYRWSSASSSDVSRARLCGRWLGFILESCRIEQTTVTTSGSRRKGSPSFGKVHLIPVR